MKRYEAVKIQLGAYLISALDWGVVVSFKPRLLYLPERKEPSVLMD